jgi:phage shock protein PspC (stress-responsive transcriptional regulator)
MRKVITINLNGNAFQVDEAGYEALSRYLDRSQARLADDPDAAEILADLEHALGEKCRETLGAHKNVVSAEEIDEILREMGPVGAESAEPEPVGASADDAAESARPLRRKLYRLKDRGSKLGGVCNGLAAYLDVDVVLVRVAFVAVTGLTGGLFAIIWFAMLFLVPVALTDAELAEARAAIKQPVHRIYRIPEEGMLGGVCAGLAAYFDVEPVLVRIAFVGLSVFTGSMWIFVWLALLLLTPRARTPEDLAAVRRGAES